MNPGFRSRLSSSAGFVAFGAVGRVASLILLVTALAACAPPNGHLTGLCVAPTVALSVGSDRPDTMLPVRKEKGIKFRRNRQAHILANHELARSWR